MSWRVEDYLRKIRRLGLRLHVREGEEVRQANLNEVK